MNNNKMQFKGALYASKSLDKDLYIQALKYENNEFLISVSNENGWDAFMKFATKTKCFSELVGIKELQHSGHGVIEKKQNITAIADSPTTYIVSIDTGKILHTLDDVGVSALVFSNDGSKLFSGSNDRGVVTIKVWDTKSWNYTNILKMPTSEFVAYLTITNDDRFLYFSTAGWDDEIEGTVLKQVVKWDLFDCKEVAVFNSPNNVTYKLFINDIINDKLLNSENFKKYAKYGCNGNVIMSEGGKFIIIKEDKIDDNSDLFSTKNGEVIRILNSETLEVLAELNGHIGGICCLSISKDNNLLAAGGENGQVCVWYLPELKLVETFRAHLNGISLLSFSNDSKYLLSVGTDEKICKKIDYDEFRCWHKPTVKCWI